MVVREGANVTLTCQAHGFPEPYIMWRREDSSEMLIGGENGNQICIKHLFYYPPRLFIGVRSLSSDKYRFFIAFVVVCLFLFPYFITITKKSKNNFHLFENLYIYFLFSISTHTHTNTVNAVDGEVLSISKISRLHMAVYLCVASNGVPPSVSKRIHLRVQCNLSNYILSSTYIHNIYVLSAQSMNIYNFFLFYFLFGRFFQYIVPPMISIPNQLEGAYLGQNVVLECHTEAYPLSINYWTTETGDMIISDASRAGDRYETMTHTTGYTKTMKLKIKNVGPSDFGTYKCIAKNSLGETDGMIKLDGKK